MIFQALSKHNRILATALGLVCTGSTWIDSPINPLADVKPVLAATISGVLQGPKTVFHRFKTGASSQDILLSVPEDFKADVTVTQHSASGKQSKTLTLAGVKKYAIVV